MAHAKIRVGIIGLSASGGWAGRAHLPALRSLPDDFEVVGLSASSEASARAAAEMHGVSFHTADAAALAARTDVDLVVVAVKVPHHRELVETALNAGKMVYCEWPLAKNVAEAEGLIALAERAGVRTFTGLQSRSSPSVRYLRDLIRSGAIGDVLSTTIVGSGGPPWGGAATSANAYTLDRSSGAEMLTIPFGHTIDGMTWILGDFTEIRATLAVRRRQVAVTDTGGTMEANTADQVAISGILEGGAVAAMHYRGGASKGTNFLWEINGTKGDIVVTGGTGHLQFGMIKIQLAAGDDALTDMPVPDEYLKVAGTPTHPSFGLAHAFRAVADDVRSGGKTVPDFADALKLHRLLARIEEAGGY